MEKISEEFLKYSRELVRIDGVDLSSTIKIAHPSDCTNYVIDNTSEHKEKIAVYDNGLAIYFDQTLSKITFKSNYPFVDKEDGNVWIMNE